MENIKHLIDKESVKLIRGDITVEKIFENVHEKFDLVTHIAANSDVRTEAEYTGKDMDINVKGTYNVLELMKRRKIT